jgi:hypothetical protein
MWHQLVAEEELFFQLEKGQHASVELEWVDA